MDKVIRLQSLKPEIQSQSWEDCFRQDLRARKVCYVQRTEVRSMWLQLGDGGKTERRAKAYSHEALPGSGGHGYKHD